MQSADFGLVVWAPQCDPGFPVATLIPTVRRAWYPAGGPIAPAGLGKRKAVRRSAPHIAYSMRPRFEGKDLMTIERLGSWWRLRSGMEWDWPMAFRSGTAII